MRRVFAVTTGLLISGYTHSTPVASMLDRIKENGELVIVTRNGPTSYYETAAGPKGFEYDLAKMFADQLGVGLRVIAGQSFAEVVAMLGRDGADLAVGLPITETGQRLVRYSPPYQETVQQVVYRITKARPRTVKDLADGVLQVVAGSTDVERLLELRARYPDLVWKENPELDREHLMRMVWDEVIDYTIASTNEVALIRRYYPELRAAFDLGKPQHLAWAVARHSDDSLYAAAVKFLNQVRKDGVLAQLDERYYGHLKNLGYVDKRTFLAHIEQRLPRYRSMFEEAEGFYGLDWHLLAAIGYQESRWDPAAVSPTGVRGIMMLTNATASLLGIRDRVDPRESILGGARYFDLMRLKIPERIPEPDRTWLALAAYNVGLGHLEDARIITQKRGGNPDKWVDVKKNLPLLAQKKWHQQTRNGYARGREPVNYVENIRAYHEILQWAIAQEKSRNARTAKTTDGSHDLSFIWPDAGCQTDQNMDRPDSAASERTPSTAARTPPPANHPTTPLCG